MSQLEPIFFKVLSTSILKYQAKVLTFSLQLFFNLACCEEVRTYLEEEPTLSHTFYSQGISLMHFKLFDHVRWK